MEASQDQEGGAGFGLRSGSGSHFNTIFQHLIGDWISLKKDAARLQQAIIDINQRTDGGG